MIAVDTNILVYAHDPASALRERAEAALARASTRLIGWGLPFPVLAEFWAVVTHPQQPHPTPPETARGFIRWLIAGGGAAVWGVPGAVGFDLLSEAARRRCCGRAVFDLQIGQTALANGATEMWSHDAAFPRLPGLVVVDPLADRQAG